MNSSRGSRIRSKNGGYDNGNDVIDVWQPGEGGAGARESSPSTPTANAPANSFQGKSSAIISRRNNSSSRGARSVRDATAPPQTSPEGTPLAASSPFQWGLLTVPLSVFGGTLSDDDDDVRFTASSFSSGVVDLTVASAPVAQTRGLTSDGSGGGGVDSKYSNPLAHGRRRRRRSLPLPSLLPMGAEIVDLASSTADFGPPQPPFRRSGGNLGGAGSNDDRNDRQQQHSTSGSFTIAASMRKRHAQGQETALLPLDKTKTAVAAAAASGGAGAGAAGVGSDQAWWNSAPSAAKQGKACAEKKRQKKGHPEVCCIVCFENSAVDRCAHCPEGHAMCKTCVTSYVTETLMPQETVFWDRIKCGGSSTCGHLFGPSVTSVLPRPIVKKIETKQMDVAHLVAGERDPTSDKWISGHSKDCPNCGVPIQRSSGCMHMRCIICRHDFWYDCDCRYPGHRRDCKKHLY